MTARSASGVVTGLLLALVAVVTVAPPAGAVVGTPVALPDPSPQVRLVGSGWGHGVGMSQYGAYAQALRGWSADRILRHWYPGVEVGQSEVAGKPIAVNLSSSARAPEITVERGSARWQVCSPRCIWVTSSSDSTRSSTVTQSSGARVIQRAGSGTWSVVASNDGALSLRRGTTVVWQGTTASTLRLRLSDDAADDTVARVLGTRYRWGSLELFSDGGAACHAPALCVNVTVPSVERYLYGLAEMPSGWAPEALTAQAIVGRTYALRMLDRGLRASCRCHLLATPADQVYAGLTKEEGTSGDRWVGQVDASAGRVVRYDGRLAATFYSSSHGARSERVGDSWAFSAPTSEYPYLDSVDDPYSADTAVGNPYARWTTNVSNSEFARYVDDRLQRVTSVRVLSRTAGGTPKRLEVAGVNRDGEALTVPFDGDQGKVVSGTRVYIAGVDLKKRFVLRSQQLSRIGLAPFGDDDGNVHEYAIATLAAADVVTGCADDRFCPTAPVTRAQTAALLVRALQLPPSAVDTFSDDGGSIHEPAINALAAAGLANGCTLTEFCPGAALTRGQMAALLARALELPPTTTDAFGDDDGTEHEDDINRLAAAGITFGVTPQRFAPGDGVTRAQMASLVVRALR